MEFAGTRIYQTAHFRDDGVHSFKYLWITSLDGVILLRGPLKARPVFTYPLHIFPDHTVIPMFSRAVILITGAPPVTQQWYHMRNRIVTPCTYVKSTCTTKLRESLLIQARDD